MSISCLLLCLHVAVSTLTLWVTSTDTVSPAESGAAFSNLCQQEANTFGLLGGVRPFMCYDGLPGLIQQLPSGVEIYTPSPSAPTLFASDATQILTSAVGIRAGNGDIPGFGYPFTGCDSSGNPRNTCNNWTSYSNIYVDLGSPQDASVRFSGAVPIAVCNSGYRAAYCMAGFPTTAPTQSPTSEPTVSPTSQPTVPPTSQPTVSPTSQPTTSQPTVPPTSQPTVSPTSQPTNQPSIAPSNTISASVVWGSSCTLLTLLILAS
jgi:cell division septation protein DedD